MNAALKAEFVPALRDAGFRGSLPHFRRQLKDRIDLLTIQFDQWGGGFVVEISNCEPVGVTMHWGEKVPPGKVTVHHLHPDKRLRIQARPGPGTDDWFRFENTDPVSLAREITARLTEAETWWASAPNSSLERTRGR
jgi:hypothetical protein